MKPNLNKRKIWISASAITVIVLVLAGSFFYLNSNNSNSGKLSVTIGVIPVAPSGLLFIAQNQSYYGQNGLNVTLENSLSGVAALNDLISGKIDVAEAPEFTAVGKVLNNYSNISIISTFSKSEVDILIARTDRGIQNTSDLVGKKIGVGFGGIGQFYLDRYLSLNHISPSSVTIVNIPPQQQADALVNGTIDALERDMLRFRWCSNG
jgi:ABC-type nitrate/sulfonate/bicarbonate transport system substrate-binding protein